MSIKWEEGAPAPVGHYDHAAVWLNGLVYVGGGHTTDMLASYAIDCYDPVKNIWNPPINSPCCWFAMTTLNKKLLIVGGEDRRYETTRQVLTLDAGQLKNYTKMIRARSLAAAAGYHKMLIITGGVNSKNKILSSTELFDSSNGQWYLCNDLPQPHYWLESVIVNSILYVLGGSNKDGASPAVFAAPLDTLSRYQLKWNAYKDTPCCWSAPLSINNTHLLIVGGCQEIGNEFIHTSNVYRLNKISHSWETIGQIPSARDSLAAISTADNRVIVIGGRNNKKEHTNTVWIGSCEPQ